jgi:hypothetical protein
MSYCVPSWTQGQIDLRPDCSGKGKCIHPVKWYAVFLKLNAWECVDNAECVISVGMDRVPSDLQYCIVSKFEVLTALQVAWDVTLCRLVKGYRLFGGGYNFHLQGQAVFRLATTKPSSLCQRLKRLELANDIYLLFRAEYKNMWGYISSFYVYTA